MEEKPNYYAVIPANVRYDDNLKLGEKMMFGEITALTTKTGECWASNNYFARLYNVTPQAISKWINTLEKQKYISIDYVKDGNRIDKRIIKMVSTGIDRVSTDVDRGINTGLQGYQRTIKENNTSNNNTSINNIRNIKEKYFETDELNDLFYEFLDMRKKLRAVNSERAIKSLLKKLSLYDDNTKYKMIEQSIVKSWKDIYELKTYKQETINKAPTPSWLGKNFKEEHNLTEDEKELIRSVREGN